MLMCSMFIVSVLFYNFFYVIEEKCTGTEAVGVPMSYKSSVGYYFFINLLWVTTWHTSCFQDMGTLVLGKVESGVINKGDQVLLMPNRVSIILYNKDIL